MIRLFIVLTIFIFSLSPVCMSATYYVDFTSGANTNNGLGKDTAWKTHPGMQSAEACTGTGSDPSYSHSAGDVYIFKGGVTWPLACMPLTISQNGTAENVDTFTVDETWYSGASYSKPVFDGENGIGSGGYLVNLSFSNYVKINGLKLVNVGESGVLDNKLVINIAPTLEGIEISDNELIGYCNHGIKAAYSGAVSISNGVKILRNKFSHFTNAIESAPTLDTEIIDGITISDNEFFDPHSQLVGGDHGDGIHLFTVLTGKPSTFTNVVVSGNSFYGDWGGSDNITSSTAQIYFEYVVDTAKVYNNSHTFSNTSHLRDNYLIANGVMTITAGTSIEIYNNSINASNMSSVSGAHGVSTGIVSGSNGRGTTITKLIGNIIVGTRYGITLYTGFDGNESILDYNVILPRSSDGLYGVYDYTGGSQSFCTTLEQWQSKGLGANDINSDPLYVSATSLALQSGSPAIDALPAASAPTTLFSTDILGVSRPQGTEWDIGAYEYDTLHSVPDAPTIGTATAGNAQATVAFTPPADDGNSTITGYTATSSPGSITGTGESSPITVTGLTNGTAYTFTVTATNAYGTSAASGASNEVTPTAPPTTSVTTGSGSLNMR